MSGDSLDAETHQVPANAAAAARVAGIPTRALRLLHRAEQWMARGELDIASRTLSEAISLSPGHPEPMRLLAVVRHGQKRYPESIALLRDALARRPNDALIHNNLGSAYGESGDLDAAAASFRRATELAPHLAAAWFNLGHTCDRLSRKHDAERAYARTLALDPSHVPARIARAGTLTVLGDLDESAAEFREALRRQPDAVSAWSGLAGLKSTRLDEAEIARLGELYRSGDLDINSRIVLGFAYGQALQALERYADAFPVFVEANAARCAQLPWNILGLGTIVDDIAGAFAEPVRSASDPALGSEAIFLIGMPRSGSTLAEQILCAHAEVEGVGESGDLPAVILEESSRRGVDFPHWVADTDAEGWQRLGKAYLDRAAARRGSRARFTDKTLPNWQLVGAAHAMLPGARFIDCRRDPLETCWSGFTHLFSAPQPFTYAFDRLAAYWRDYDRLMQAWHVRYPGLVYRHEHESLLDDPDASIRRLLEAAGLHFDPSCLAFHRVERPVHTSSASQVRQPIQRGSAYGLRYGPLLDPLRDALNAKA